MSPRGHCADDASVCRNSCLSSCIHGSMALRHGARPGGRNKKRGRPSYRAEQLMGICTRTRYYQKCHMLAGFDASSVAYVDGALCTSSPLYGFGNLSGRVLPFEFVQDADSLSSPRRERRSDKSIFMLSRVAFDSVIYRVPCDVDMPASCISHLVALAPLVRVELDRLQAKPENWSSRPLPCSSCGPVPCVVADFTPPVAF
ncbi:hypothetical protein QBC34DRAFT_492057 [Podospora aff. communis PSN243]|uniref:Uncharacterized protein n=1 Tax=Podospora aff. communis PSN243 TaxID=3040156 RepID=A0AAV9GXB1_9PEZI|nr:hypothetical protein QBC34DRAFT_492057 [Podospora aff. communis PSN243]